MVASVPVVVPLSSSVQWGVGKGKGDAKSHRFELM